MTTTDFSLYRRTTEYCLKTSPVHFPVTCHEVPYTISSHYCIFK